MAEDIKKREAVTVSLFCIHISGQGVGSQKARGLDPGSIEINPISILP